MSRVVVVKRAEGSIDGGVDTRTYRRLLEAGLSNLNSAPNVGSILSTILQGGVVGFKTSCLARRFNSTPVALVDALTVILMDHGFEANDLIIWERTSRELADGGFTLNAAGRGVRCLGTDANGVGYASEFSSFGQVSSLVSRIMTEMIDSSINLPVLKDHSIAGLSAGMKNMYGAIHNPNKFHADCCDPYCAHVNNLAPIRQKNRLTIIDAMRVQYDGGPGYVDRFVAKFGALIISRDPVAADRVGLEIVEHLRERNGRPTLAQSGREVRYLRTAKSIGLGEADLAKIDLKVLLVDDLGHAEAGRLFG
ncbi:MAG: DUF362 domain-containing protein [Candidatus Zixiibacteriota bacterium]